LVIQYLTRCRAIHTYENRGTTAPHARPRDHVVIYTGEKQPDLVEGESKVVLNRKPIRVTLDPKGQPLRPASRLSLSKLHTVEHDIPVSRLGKITPRDVEKIRQYCAEVQGLFFASGDRTSEALDDVGEDDEEGDEYDG
jgi:hypothetical protein